MHGKASYCQMPRSHLGLVSALIIAISARIPRPAPECLAPVPADLIPAPGALPAAALSEAKRDCKRAERRDVPLGLDTPVHCGPT